MKALSGKTDMYNLVSGSAPNNSILEILCSYVMGKEKPGFYLDPYHLWRGTEVILDEIY